MLASDIRVPRFATVDLRGQRVLGTHAVGKHLLTRTDAGLTLHSHRRMEGRWVTGPAVLRTGPAHQIRVILRTADSAAIGVRLAMVEIAPRCDAVVVIGSANSSNTVALAKVAAEAGAPRVIRVNSAAELPDDLTGVVGVTAGASAPESLVEEVIAALAPTEGVEEVATTDEDEYFPPPRNLRDLLAGIDALATFSLGGSVADRPATNDRQVRAAQALHDL